MNDYHHGLEARKFFFWLLWVICILPVLYYMIIGGIGIIIALEAINFKAYFVWIPSFVALIAQIYTLKKTWSIAKSGTINGLGFMILIGGTLAIAFMWTGGCLLTGTGTRIAG